LERTPSDVSNAGDDDEEEDEMDKTTITPDEARTWMPPRAALTSRHPATGASKATAMDYDIGELWDRYIDKANC
jgi:hypothetical protein